MITRVPTVAGLWYAVRCEHCRDESAPQPVELDARQQADLEGYLLADAMTLCADCAAWVAGSEVA